MNIKQVVSNIIRTRQITNVFTLILLFFFLVYISNCKPYFQLTFRNKTVLLPESHINRKQPVVSNLIIVRFKNSINLPSIGEYYRKYRVVDRLLSPSNLRTDFKRDRVQKKIIDNDLLKKAEDELLRSFIFEYDGNSPPELESAKIMLDCSDIEIAEPYYLYEPQGKFIPNDTLVPKQLMLETIQAFEAWDLFKGDTSVVIGISDTGVMQEHEDLFENIHKNYNEIPDNGIDDDLNGYIDDYAGVNFSYRDDSTSPGSTFNKEGHGTLTVGISSATTNNITGLAGVGYKCRFFPMKAGLNDTKYIYYGVQSIIYAAQNEIDVLNCSWGGQSYSCFAQSAVDYSIANDVAIVAAAGNHANYTPFYPAGYKGVLGVGVTDAKDTVIEMSATGAHVDLMAPGQGAVTTNQLVKDDTVSSIYHISCCTSAASPIVAGAVALVRAKYPELNSQQAIVHTRLNSDNIKTINPQKADLIPGRINLFKIIANNPFSQPGFEILDLKYISISGKRARFSENDTFVINLKLKNWLGKGEGIRFSIEKVMDNFQAIELIDSTTFIDIVEPGETITLDNFKFKINQTNLHLMFFAINISYRGVYKDRILIPIIPGSDYATFSNDVIRVSVSDNGRIGFSDFPYNQRGEGFIFKGYCNTLFEGSFFATESRGKVVSQARNQKGKNENDFLSAKPFSEPDEKFGLFWDGKAFENDRIGLLIRNFVDVASKDTPCVRFELKITNISGNSLQDLSAAYFFDWDLGADADSNIIKPFPESINPIRKGKNTASALIYREGYYPYIGVLVSSDNINAIAQMVSIKNDELFYDGLISDEQKRLFLNSGTDLFNEIKGEISMVAGMKFPYIIPADSSATFSILVCSEKNVSDLIKVMQSFSKNIITKVEKSKSKNSDMILISNYNFDKLIIKYINQSHFKSIQIYDLMGKLHSSIMINNIEFESEYEIKIDNLASGTYFIVIKSDTHHKVFPLMIYK